MNLVELLNRAGYEAITINDTIPPCTLLQNGEPMGFLKSDLSTVVVEDQAVHRSELESLVNFAIDTSRCSELSTGESVLSQYENHTFVTGYDFYEKKPYFRVYEGKEENQKIVATGEDRQTVSQTFAEISGLSQPPKAAQHEPKHMRMKIPGIFHILKESLQQLGLNLRMYFGIGEAHAVIQQNHFTVATVDENLKVSYSERTGTDLKERIDSVVAQVRSQLEKKEQQEQAVPQQEVIQQPVQAQAPQQAVHQPVQTQVPQQAVQQPVQAQVPQQTVHQPVQTQAPQQVTLTAEQAQLREQFLTQHQLYMTAKGFGGNEIERMKESLQKQFGTTDPAVFQKKLERGDYTKQPGTFALRMEHATQVAEQRNMNRASQKQASERSVAK